MTDSCSSDQSASQSGAAAMPARPSVWLPIETAPAAGSKPMFVVRGFAVCNGFTGGTTYTTDAWCVWRDSDGKFARWPHHFAPTHWLPLPEPPQEAAAPLSHVSEPDRT